MVFTPLASVQFTRLDIDGYTETGAGGINLAVDDDEINFLQTGLGGRITFPTRTAGGTRVIPEIRALWLFDILGEEQSSVARFTGGGTAFTSNGPDPAQHGAQTGVGLRVSDPGSNVSLSVNYDAEYRQDFLGHSGQLTLRVGF